MRRALQSAGGVRRRFEELVASVELSWKEIRARQLPENVGAVCGVWGSNNALTITLTLTLSIYCTLPNGQALNRTAIIIKGEN